MKNKLIPACLGAFLFLYHTGFASEWIQLRGVMHVHTDFDGTGEHSLAELVSMAKQAGIEVLIPTDHDLQVMAYGLPPFRNLIRIKSFRNSVLQIGPEKYLQQINRMNQSQQDVLVIPGVQSSPFYYWSGNPFSGTLLACDYRKELLIIGMRRPEDYKGLPLLHRGFSTRYLTALAPRSFFFLAALIISIYFVRRKGFLRRLGYVLATFSLLLLIDQHPFQSAGFDPYHGDQGIAPFQEVIDYVNDRGGSVFWAHPESNYAVKGVQMGTVTMRTAHYPEVLSASTDYAGFEAVYGDTISVTNPGMHWDRVLTAYCSGDRYQPAWGMAGADFHGNRKEEKLDEFQTVFLVKEKRSSDILEALSKGRMYALRKGVATGLVLKRFVMKDDQTGRVAHMGQTLTVTGPPEVQIEIAANDDGPHDVTIRLVRNGEVIKSFFEKTPAAVYFRDQTSPEGLSHYRLDVKGPKAGTLLSNPIFVKKRME